MAVLRTFSKIYGLAGLRVGYMVGPPEVVREVMKMRNAVRRRRSWPTSRRSRASTTPTSCAAGATLNERGRAELGGGVRGARACAPFPACANFLAVDVGDGRALAGRSLREGVIVRPLDAVRRAGVHPRDGRHARGERRSSPTSSPGRSSRGEPPPGRPARPRRGRRAAATSAPSRARSRSSRTATRWPTTSCASSIRAPARRPSPGSPARPGVGKSSLIGALVGHLRGAGQDGRRACPSTRPARSPRARCWATASGSPTTSSTRASSSAR